MCLFVKQSEGSTGADDSNFGPKQGGGDSEKMFSKLLNKKSKQTLAGLKGSEFWKILMTGGLDGIPWDSKCFILLNLS